MATELFYCAAGNARLAQIAISHGMSYGAQLPAQNVYFPVQFADQDWKKPDRARYMQALAQHKPRLATVLDLEHEHQLEQVLAWAEEASQHVSEAVIIIPKVMSIIPRLPHTLNGKQVRLGYSVPTKYGGTSVPTWEFGNRPVHLLGGSPKAQIKLTHYLNVASADGNYIAKLATNFNKAWTLRGDVALSEFQAPTPNDAPYLAFELSVKNLLASWEGCHAQIRYARFDDVQSIMAIAKQYKTELGFVRKVAIEEAITKGEVIIALNSGRVVGFCNFHKRKDGIHTIYELAVDKYSQGQRIGAGLLAAIPRPRQLKTTLDNNQAIGFYHNHLVFKGIEQGKKRPLVLFGDLLINY